MLIDRLALLKSSRRRFRELLGTVLLCFFVLSFGPLANRGSSFDAWWPCQREGISPCQAGSHRFSRCSWDGGDFFSEAEAASAFSQDSGEVEGGLSDASEGLTGIPAAPDVAITLRANSERKV